MSILKIILSRIAGKKPSINQMESDDNNVVKLGANERDGKLFMLKVNEDGSREIVEFVGVLPGSFENHPRAHQIDNIADHPAVTDPSKKGKFVVTNPETGAIEFTDNIDCGYYE